MNTGFFKKNSLTDIFYGAFFFGAGKGKPNKELGTNVTKPNSSGHEGEARAEVKRIVGLKLPMKY